MVPAAFVVLESLPLTPNGKLDTRALPAPRSPARASTAHPSLNHEQLVASLFAELTGATRVGLDDSFFALGGHSLLAMRLISQIRTRTGLELALRTLFEQPTVTVLARHWRRCRPKCSHLLQAVKYLSRVRPSSQVRACSIPKLMAHNACSPSVRSDSGRLSRFSGVSGNYNMPAALKLSGALQSQALALSLNDVIQRHEPLRTVIASVGGEPVGFVRELGPETTLLAL